MREHTPVPKSLDRKLLIFGFEIPDLLAIFLFLSVLNLFFGNMEYQIFYVWLPPLVLALILRAAKKNKPDNFLVHFLRYQVMPGIIKAYPQNSDSPFLKGFRNQLKLRRNSND